MFQIKAEGGDVRVVYSPLDCLKVARENPGKQVVFFAIGFETTAPANAMSVWLARAQEISNYSILVSHVTVPPAMTAVLESPGNRVQAFLGAGHVCAVMGWEEYEPLAACFRVPIVITGFEPLDLLEGILMAVRQLESGRHEVENQYARAVSRQGNPEARKMIARVFAPCDRAWRGIGVIPASGYRLRDEFAAFDAARIFDLAGLHPGNRKRASADWCYRERGGRSIAPLLEPRARRRRLWAQPWSLPRAPARRTTTTEGAVEIAPASGSIMTDFALSCPLPMTQRKTIVLGHGSGGKLSAQLIREMFLPAFDNPLLNRLDDQAVLMPAECVSR